MTIIVIFVKKGFLIKRGDKIPIAFTQGADPKDISEAIGEFLKEYNSKTGSEEKRDDCKEEQTHDGL